jgi:hypothetical protein
MLGEPAEVCREIGNQQTRRRTAIFALRVFLSTHVEVRQVFCVRPEHGRTT